MSMEQAARAVRRRIEPLVQQLAAQGLPVTLGDGPPKEVDRLSPVVWVEADGLAKAKVRRTPHVSEGDDGHILEIDAYLLDAGETQQRAAEWLEELASLLRQDVRITADGGDPGVPQPCHYMAHPLLLDVARKMGWSMSDVVRPTTMRTHDGIMTARSKNGVYTDLLSGEIDGMRIALTRRLVRRRVLVDSLAINPAKGSAPSSPRVLYSDADGRPVLRIIPATLPETALAALSGRCVSDVLHGASARAFGRHRIAEAYSGEGDQEVCLHLEGDAVTIV